MGWSHSHAVSRGDCVFRRSGIAIELPQLPFICTLRTWAVVVVLAVPVLLPVGVRAIPEFRSHLLSRYKPSHSRWQARTIPRCRVESSPVVANGVVYINGDDLNVYAFDLK
jgi:hypothetical protein